MLTRKPTAQPQETHWFMFSAGLMNRASSDYIAMCLLHQSERLTCAPTICVMMLDVVEKSLKLHLAVHAQPEDALALMSTKYGHNLEALRDACSAHTPLFADDDVRAFTRDLTDRDGKLYQQLRYGSQKTTSGFQTNLSTLRPVVDKIFCEAILQLPEHIRKVLVHSSPIQHLLVGSRLDQSRDPVRLLEAIRIDNEHFDRLSEYCGRLEEEQTASLAAIISGQPGSGDA